MKQLNFIKKTEDEMGRCSADDLNYWKLFIDGASRNNPGPAGAGIYLLKGDEVIEKKGFYLGSKTNNQAEYLSLLLGLFFLRKYVCKDDLVIITSDSELLVRQMKGAYKVKNTMLKPLYQLANKLLKGIKYNFTHVLREDNADADYMANVGIDKGMPLPQDFLNLLQDHEISI